MCMIRPLYTQFLSRKNPSTLQPTLHSCWFSEGKWLKGLDFKPFSQPFSLTFPECFLSRGRQEATVHWESRHLACSCRLSRQDACSPSAPPPRAGLLTAGRMPALPVHHRLGPACRQQAGCLRSQQKKNTDCQSSSTRNRRV